MPPDYEHRLHRLGQYTTRVSQERIACVIPIHELNIHIYPPIGSGIPEFWSSLRHPQLSVEDPLAALLRLLQDRRPTHKTGQQIGSQVELTRQFWRDSR